jgi:hypothetical protein
MPHQIVAFFLCALVASFIWPTPATAEMGPCRPAGEETLICGIGDGVASVIPQTISPSKRLAVGWRLTNRAPISKPYDHDPDLENIILRIEDGAVLAKTHGTYWRAAGRTARANVFAAWSPDSRLLVAGMESVDSENVELFKLAEDDTVTGPFNLAAVLEPAVRAKMRGIKNANEYTFRISYKPGISIDNNGLIHASVYMAQRDSGEGPAYDLIAQVNRTAASMDINLLSVSEFHGLIGSITIH